MTEAGGTNMITDSWCLSRLVDKETGFGAFEYGLFGSTSCREPRPTDLV